MGRSFRLGKTYMGCGGLGEEGAETKECMGWRESCIREHGGIDDDLHECGCKDELDA